MAELEAHAKASIETSSHAEELNVMEQIKQQIRNIADEWYLLVLIFLGALVPSLSLEDVFPGRLPYIIRSTFQVGMFWGCLRTGQIVVEGMRKDAERLQKQEAENAEKKGE